MNISPYIRRAQFYETDQMAIVHHANYIRWFEEARVDLMEQMGYSYVRMEAEGIGSPLTGVSCEYKAPVRFGDTVEIHAAITRFNGVRLTMSYRVVNRETGALCTTGETRHCFARHDGKPISLKRVRPDIYDLFLACFEAGQGAD